VILILKGGFDQQPDGACVRGGAVYVLYLAARPAMGSTAFSARYTAAMAECGGRCPIEAGVLGRLADHECRHGRLPGDRTAPCGCWRGEGEVVVALSRPVDRPPVKRRAA
jgi:hypothetical protein